MKRLVQCLNFIGIFALAGLCCVQWQRNRQVNLEAIRLEKIRIEQAATIESQDRAIKGYVADLDDFRQRLTLAESELKESQNNLAQRTAERDQLKSALDKWMAAVAQRDVALKQAGEQILKLSSERNEAITKFNDLAGKYNAIVKGMDAPKANP